MTTSMGQLTGYLAVTRIVADDGVEELQALILPADADLTEGWDELRSRLAVDEWRSYLQPDDATLCLPADRVDVMLSELGWSACGQVVIGRPFPVERRRTVFRACEVRGGARRRVIVLRAGAGDPVASYGAEDQPMPDVLAANGWAAHALHGWSEGNVAVDPIDWDCILQAVTAERRQVQQDAKTVDGRWRTLVREAVLAGVDVARISNITSITRQRIYQIRDGRR